MSRSNSAGHEYGCGFYVETWRGDRWGASAWFELWSDAEAERKRLTKLCDWPKMHKPRMQNAGN